MKNKYINSMIAGLMVLGLASCDKEAVTSVTEVAGKVAEAAASTGKVTTSEEASAYYVMFKGQG